MACSVLTMIDGNVLITSGTTTESELSHQFAKNLTRSAWRLTAVRSVISYMCRTIVRASCGNISREWSSVFLCLLTVESRWEKVHALL